MQTILSRHFPPLPIDINYDYYRSVCKTPMTAKDTSRMHAALKRPDRIRGIVIAGPMANLDRFFKATKSPLPALESLELRSTHHTDLAVPATFLEGLNLHLRTLKLNHISLQSILQLVSFATVLTYLSLEIYTYAGQPPVISPLLSHFQGMLCLRRLDLVVNSHIDNPTQPTEHKKDFTLSKLGFFHYRGHSAYLDTFVAGVSAPSLRKIDVRLSDITPPPIPHLSPFIKDVVEDCHVV
jgi:hypothetical protein